MTDCTHFGLGTYVKRAHHAPEKVIAVVLTEWSGIRLTLLAEDGSVSHVKPIALNRNGLSH